MSLPPDVLDRARREAAAAPPMSADRLARVASLLRRAEAPPESAPSSSAMRSRRQMHTGEAAQT